MDATCAIQASIHVFSLVRKYVSRILGTYQAAEWQAKIRELEKQKQEEENSQIVQAVRSLKLTPAQLMAFLNDPKNSLTTSDHTDPKPEAPEKEDTAHEEN